MDNNISKAQVPGSVEELVEELAQNDELISLVQVNVILYVYPVVCYCSIYSIHHLHDRIRIQISYLLII